MTKRAPNAHLGVKGLRPTMHNVPLSDGSVATVPIFDVKETLFAFLNNPGWMRVKNIAPNYDPFTGKSTIMNPLLDEIHTEPYGMPHASIIVAMTPTPSHWR